MKQFMNRSTLPIAVRLCQISSLCVCQLPDQQTRCVVCCAQTLLQLHLNVTNCCGTVGYQVYGDDDYGDAVRARPWPPVTEINLGGRPRKKAKARRVDRGSDSDSCSASHSDGSSSSDDDDVGGDGGGGGGSSVGYSNSNQFDLDLDNDLADGLFGNIS